MDFWVIALPVGFGVGILLAICACCCCRCKPEKVQPEEEGEAARAPEVIRVVLYPEADTAGLNNSNTTDSSNGNNNAPYPQNTHDHHGEHGEVRIGAAASSSLTNTSNLEYRYYPLQVGERRPVTAAVVNPALTDTESPCVGTVVTTSANGAVGRSTGTVRPLDYGEAVYVSRSESAIASVTKPTDTSSD